jgi:hypothetical protein
MKEQGLAHPHPNVEAHVIQSGLCFDYIAVGNVGA